MKTRFEIPHDHPALQLGCPPVLHFGCWQHQGDPGGNCGVVSVLIPEANHLLPVAIERAIAFKARVLIAADTHRQVEDVAKRFIADLPSHRRVSLERAMAGGWTLM